MSVSTSPPRLNAIPDELKPKLARWLERVAELPPLQEACGALADPWRAELMRVAACSEFAAAALLQDPEALPWLVRHDHPASAQAAMAEYAGRVAAAGNPAEAMAVLREWRRRAMLRIAWRDIADRAPVTETLRDSSDLADRCIGAAWIAAQRQLDDPFGRPRDEHRALVPFIVVAMGKLGGRELNFSSDIDLVFLYGGAGETDGPRPLDNGEYFQRAGRELIRLLDAHTEAGFVFRVDMRLRPFGDSGALVVSLAALEDYLQEHGRDWERYAWIKARAVVGGGDFAAVARDYVRPFVYRRYLDYGVFESLRAMKALIAREVSRHQLDQHLKLGPGGIRELEFIVQSLQLVRGGSDHRLQNAALLDVLPLLAGSKLLSKPSVDELQGAYLTLRKAENALQMIRDEQTHALPDEPLDRARLALIMGAADWPAAIARIDAARDAVARQFQALVFGHPDSQASGADAALDWLGASESISGDELQATFSLSATELAPMAALLDGYRHSAAYRRLDEAARRRIHVILVRTLKAAAQRPFATAVVQRVLRVLEAIGARSSYLALLKEQPPALDRLIDVCAVSSFLARQIAEFPLLLDELIDPQAFDELPTRPNLTAELESRTERLPVGDPERQVEALRQFQKAAVFRVAFADLTGRLPLMQVSDRLTDVAELIVERCLHLAWDQMVACYGAPFAGTELEPRPVAVAVAGYGKLGGLELGYGSDLDLVFLHDSSGELQQTRHERPLDNAVFFLRLGQRIVHLLTMHSAAGRLYEVDMRLRPNGKGGFLMTGIDAFERYQQVEAWTWEHQALLRARAIAGDWALGRRFESARRRALSSAVHRDTLRSDVAGMRARMHRELSRARPGQFDIKQDPGGLADIEFLVQYWVLATAHAHPQLIDHTDNVRQLEGLAAVGVLDAATADGLKAAYLEYRTSLHHRSLDEADRVVDSSSHADTRAYVKAVWRRTFDDNALLEPWDGPYGGTPPFDRVRVDDFEPAFEAAMEAKLRDIDGIVSQAAAPTFENTIRPLEAAGAAFDRVNALYEIWSTSLNEGAFQAVERAMGPKLAAFNDSILQNEALFARIAAVHAARGALDPVQRRLCEQLRMTFIRGGAGLPGPAQERVTAINGRLAGAYAQFAQNLLAEEAAPALLATERDELSGLPDGLCDAAAAAAAALGRPGSWAVLNTRSAVEPFLTFATRRDLRERVWRSFYERGSRGGEHDNTKLVAEILELRRERAQLLGFPTHAHWRLADSMAKDPEAARALLMSIWPEAVARLRAELDELRALESTVNIEPWDYRFLAERLRQSRLDLDMQEVKPHLQLENMREAMFWSAQRLYGFSFVRLEGLPVVHPAVRVWEVRSSAGFRVGLWYFDPYVRSGKSSGAWMSEYRAQSKLEKPVTPIVSNNTNFLKNPGTAPVLISWDDAVTLFHEFGHALHALNSDVEFPSLSGTRVVRDFVELPSQLNENWLSVPELLSRFALHVETGEPMPARLADKLRAARAFNQGFATVEYLAAALVDLELHLARGPVPDPAAFERETLGKLGMPPEVVMRHRPAHFAHLFAGEAYAAAYYSYLWAEVLAHDAFAAFEEAGGPFDPGVAKRLHDAIMSVGNSVDPAQAYRRFRGREPRIGALLEARGFQQEQ